MNAFRDALRDLPEAVFADVLEDDQRYLVVLDLPGATAETVEVDVDCGKLTIEARRSKNVDRSFRFLSEERSLFLDVEFPLPPDVISADAVASIADGVLEIELPKQSAQTETTITVSEG